MYGRRTQTAEKRSSETTHGGECTAGVWSADQQQQQQDDEGEEHTDGGSACLVVAHASRRRLTADGHGARPSDASPANTDAQLAAAADDRRRVADDVDAAGAVGPPLGLLQQLLRLAVLAHRYIQHLIRVFELFPGREHARLEVVDGLRVLDDELVLGLRGSTQLGEHAL